MDGGESVFITIIIIITTIIIIIRPIIPEEAAPDSSEIGDRRGGEAVDPSEEEETDIDDVLSPASLYVSEEIKRVNFILTPTICLPVVSDLSPVQ